VIVAIDGSHGEGGGQVVRTALALSAVTGRAIRIENIRAGRQKPGLAAQHLTSVRAAAAICQARVEGAELGSGALTFAPGAAARAGEYLFDVAAAREGGSAGAATLVLYTVLLPLALASGDSVVRVRGGTHVPWSPSADYARDVWLATLQRLGCHATLEISRHGFYPAGGGEIVARIRGRMAHDHRGSLDPLGSLERGELRGVMGRAITAKLPEHVGRRLSESALRLLGEAGVSAHVVHETVEATSPGAGVFLSAEYEHSRAGFGAHGARGVPAEEVAARAVHALLAHRACGAAFDEHLGDQLVLPLALADGKSEISVQRASGHMRTSAWLVEKCCAARCEIVSGPGETCILRVSPFRSGGHG
jgi:RNA 3'-terminal phosphate cyclase (ATP)